MKKQIGEHEYDVAMLPAKLGLKTLARLGKTVGPAFAGDLAGAVRSLDPDEILSLAQVFAEHTCVDLGGGRSPQLWQVFDVHFQGKYAALIEWLIFAVETNYADFLSEAGAKVASIEAKAT
jgi:tail assembly chaperone